MLQPKKTKFRKQFKGRVKGEAKGGFELAFGEFGLNAPALVRPGACPAPSGRARALRP